MLTINVILIILVHLCCLTIKWSQFGVTFSLILAFNYLIRKYFLTTLCHENSIRIIVISSYTLVWCLTFLFVLPVHFLYPAATHKLPNTLPIASSIIVLNLACIALLVNEWRQHPLRLFYSSVLRPLVSPLQWSNLTPTWFQFTRARAKLSPTKAQVTLTQRSPVADPSNNLGESVVEQGEDKSAPGLPDQSSLRKRQLYQTLKCMMAMKRRIRQYRETKRAREVQVTLPSTNSDDSSVPSNPASD